MHPFIDQRDHNCLEPSPCADLMEHVPDLPVCRVYTRFPSMPVEGQLFCDLPVRESLCQIGHEFLFLERQIIYPA